MDGANLLQALHVAPAWSYWNQTLTARYRLAAAVDSAGRIYAVGGWANALGGLGTVEDVPDGDQQWTELPSLPTPRGFLGAAAGPDGSIYAVGGWYGSQLNTVEAFSPTANTWYSVAGMPTARWGSAVARGPDGLIYAIGGYDNGLSAAVEAYNTYSTHTWIARAPLPTARERFAAAVGEGGRFTPLVVAAGLALPARSKRTILRRTPGGKWRGCPYPRRRWRRARGDGRIYVMGGCCDANGDSADVRFRRTT